MLGAGDVKKPGCQYRLKGDGPDDWFDESPEWIGTLIYKEDLEYTEFRAPVSDTPDGYVVSNTCAEDDGFARWWIDGDLPACATCLGKPVGKCDCQRCKDVARDAWMARAAIDKK